eukprot:CAMPEP_0185019192 /NCGR_PEP_ID=MMETSP1103-20130426/1821_1 /TAXON_ID=36769 /ORGANISM="Paraphysomonas bandaiensis, Strain Caron Lab Isolate" /LENGTH=506 /DNA_ID=CAMNT_0027549379 /DNA_START=247 /DNA_END=1764 /DNA_ORIENTATION=+
MIRRRISRIYAKSNSDYFSGVYTFEADEEEDTLSSGNLLNNVLLYRNFHDTWSSGAYSDRTYEFDKSTSILTRIVLDGCEQELLRGREIVKLMDSVKMLRSGLQWFHCTTRTTFHLVLKKKCNYQNALNVLMSVSPKCSIVSQRDGSLAVSLVSLFLHRSGSIKLNRLYMYISAEFVITYECVTSAHLEDIESTASKKSGPVVNYRAARRSSSAATSISHRSAGRLLSKLESGDNPFEFDIALDGVHTSGTNKEKEQCFLESVTKENEVFRIMKSRLNSDAESRKLLMERGPSFFLHEAIQAMLTISVPVINFYSARQKELNDLILINRTSENNIGEDNALLDKIELIRSGFSLLFNLTERMVLCLNSSNDVIKVAIPCEYHTQIIQDYDYTLNIVQSLDKELNKLGTKITDLSSKRDAQISVALSMVAALFFPLTFVSGVFGMNFTKGSIIVKMMKMQHGTALFIALSLCILFCSLWIVFYKGWGDSLGELHIVGRLGESLRNKW